MLQLMINFGTFNLNLINIYDLNRDSPNSFEKMFLLSQNKIADHVTRCDDFNVTLNGDVPLKPTL